MNFTEFKEAANESVLYARFMAEFNGVSVAQITLWLNCLNKPATTEEVKG